jgi:DNA-binding CsgD family transcriptional regulator
MRFGECHKKCLETIGLTHFITDVQAVADAHYFAACALVMMGDLKGAAEHARSYLAQPDDSRHLFRQRVAFKLNSDLAVLTGEWDLAREYNQRLDQIAPEAAEVMLGSVYLDLVTAEDKSQRAKAIARLNEMPTSHGMYLSQFVAIPQILMGIGFQLQRSDFIVLANPLLTEDTESFRDPPMAHFIRRVLLTVKAVLDQDQHLAERLYRAFHHDLLEVDERGTPGFVHRALGLLATVLGNYDEATVHFEKAMDFYKTGGFHPEVAWTCADSIRPFVARGTSKDLQAAAGLAQEGLRMANEYNMPALREVLSDIAVQLEPFRAAGVSYPDGLTEREVQVLRLMAQGKSNREIAEELIISQATVAAHVRSILDKAGLRNRTEAAAYAIRNGLMSS